MWVQHIEGFEPFLPVRQSTKHGKTWRRSNTPAFGRIVNRVAPSAFLARNLVTGNCISVERDLNCLADDRSRWTKRSVAIRRKTYDGALPDIRQQPVRKALRPGMQGRVQFHAPRLSKPREHRTTHVTKGDVRLIIIFHLLDLNLRFQRKPRQDVFEQTAVDQRLGRIETNQLVVRPKSPRPANQQNYQRAPKHVTSLGSSVVTRQSKSKGPSR